MRFPQKNIHPYYIPYNQIGKNSYSHIPLYVNYGRTRGSGFGSIFSFLGRHLLPLAKRYVLPAAKKLGSDILSGENVLKSAKNRALEGLKTFGEEELSPLSKRIGSSLKEVADEFQHDLSEGKNIIESSKSNLNKFKNKLMKGSGIRQIGLYSKKPERNSFGDLNLKYTIDSKKKKKITKNVNKNQKGGSVGKFKKRKLSKKKFKKKFKKKKKNRIIYPKNSIFDL